LKPNYHSFQENKLESAVLSEESPESSYDE
jgi:hypothetical protein